MCEWLKTGAGSSKSLHTCRPSCAVNLSVEGAGEFYCNSKLPCPKHSKKDDAKSEDVESIDPDTYLEEVEFLSSPAAEYLPESLRLTHLIQVAQQLPSFIEVFERRIREEDIEIAFEKSAWGKAKSLMIKQEGASEALREVLGKMPPERTCRLDEFGSKTAFENMEACYRWYNKARNNIIFVVESQLSHYSTPN